MKNFKTDVVEAINAFSESNIHSQMAQEFATKLHQQLEKAFDYQWEDKAEVESFIFGEDDVLELAAGSEDEADFDWAEARDIQREIVQNISEFNNLI